MAFYTRSQAAVRNKQRFEELFGIAPDTLNFDDDDIREVLVATRQQDHDNPKFRRAADASMWVETYMHDK